VLVARLFDVGVAGVGTQRLIRPALSSRRPFRDVRAVTNLISLIRESQPAQAEKRESLPVIDILAL
jgi:hypothetical protein